MQYYMLDLMPLDRVAEYNACFLRYMMSYLLAMTRTFVCPHCQKQYPVLPVLVGRKVRCSGCRQLFQLAFDGVAAKVTISSSPHVLAQDTALEAKSDVQSTENVSVALRPQATAIKRKTERIKRMRESLQQASVQAIDAMEDTAKRIDSLDSATDLDSQPPAAVSSSVIRSSARATKLDLRRHMLVLAVILFSMFLVTWMFVYAPLPEQLALQQFAATIGDSKDAQQQRMSIYRDRMWLHTRDGVQSPPIILNADDAQLTPVKTLDWTQVVSSCLPVLDGMEKNPRFAAFFEAGQAAAVQDLWDKHPSNHHIEAFYLAIERAGIDCIRYDALYERLVEKGVSGEALYIASLLLAGTASHDGMPCRNMGLQSGIMPELLKYAEFSGQQGIMLMQAEEGYRFVTAPVFSGLVVGFTGFPGREDEWRVIDLRLSESMDEFYARSHNPLRRAAKLVHQEMAEELLERRKRTQPPVP